MKQVRTALRSGQAMGSFMTVSGLVLVCVLGFTVAALGNNPPTLTCVGDSINCTKLLATTCVTSDPLTVKYVWYGDGLVSGQGTSCAVWNMPGPKTVYVTDTVGGGVASCVAQVIRTVPLPDVFAGCDLLRCDGGLTKVTTGPAAPHVGFHWTGPGIVSGENDLQAFVDLPGIYTVTAYDSSTGCSNSTWCEVLPAIIPQLTCTGDTLNCTDQTATTTVTTNITAYALEYVWSGDGLVSGQGTPTATWNQPGLKKVVVTIHNSGCKDSCVAEVVPGCTPPGAHIFPTQTTCSDYVNGTATRLPGVCYTASGLTVSNAVPGVFFYFSNIVAPSANFCVDVVQTKSCGSFLYFGVQQGNQAYLYSNGCTKLVQGSQSSTGQAHVCITNATAGQTYIVIVKYNVKSIIGSTFIGSAPTCQYTFYSSIGGSPVADSRDSILVTPGGCSTGSMAGLSGSEDGTLAATPLQYGLHANYPNPFNPTTMIAFDLPEPSTVHLAVFNMLGQEVATLVNGVVAAGEHSVEWNSANSNAMPLPSGVYLYRIQATSLTSGKEFHQINKMILMK